MITELSDEALEYGRQSKRAIEAAGGDEVARAAEAEPDRRGELVVPVLAELGAWDLAPGSSPDELEAAAALCRSAGYWALPYPVAERLGRPVDLSVDGQFVVRGADPSAAVVGLDGSWSAVDLAGQRSRITARPAAQAPRTSAFVTELELDPIDDAATAPEVALGLVLPCWTLLGMLDRAMDLTRDHVLERQQFGQPLARFQGVQFQLTDAEVERIGVEELAKYALWSLETGRDEVLDDALALRLAAIEAAETVFRVTHQLHGAIGFCDETTLSWLSRASQPLRRLPLSLAATREAFIGRIGHRGLSGLFDGAGGGAVTEGYDLPPVLEVIADGPIRTVVMNRPEDLNAIDEPLHWGLANVWRQIAADPEARVVILTGAGRAFSAGGDLAWITSFLDDAVARYASLREGAQIIEELVDFPLPVIAAVNGPAVGLGASMAVLSDIVLISETAYLADPHVSVGLVAGDGGAAFWPLLAPILRSREYLFTGQRIPAAVAVDIGLASRTTAPDDLLPEAQRLAERLARQPPMALRETKRVVNLHLKRAFAGPLQEGFAAEAATMETDDHRRRVRALQAKAAG